MRAVPWLLLGLFLSGCAQSAPASKESDTPADTAGDAMADGWIVASEALDPYAPIQVPMPAGAWTTGVVLQLRAQDWVHSGPDLTNPGSPPFDYVNFMFDFGPQGASGAVAVAVFRMNGSALQFLASDLHTSFDRPSTTSVLAQTPQEGQVPLLLLFASSRDRTSNQTTFKLYHGQAVSAGTTGGQPATQAHAVPAPWWLAEGSTLATFREYTTDTESFGLRVDDARGLPEFSRGVLNLTAAPSSTRGISTLIVQVPYDGSGVGPAMWKAGLAANGTRMEAGSPPLGAGAQCGTASFLAAPTDAGAWAWMSEEAWKDATRVRFDFATYSFDLEARDLHMAPARLEFASVVGALACR